MNRARVIPALAIAALALGSLAIAAPASAAPGALPAGSGLYTFNCERDTSVPDLAVFSLNSATAVLTPIGAGIGTSTGQYCTYPAAWDFTSSTGYVLYSFSGSESGPPLFYVASVDLTTGVVATGVELMVGDVPASVDTIAFDLDGNLYGLTEGHLVSIDPLTGDVADLGATGLDRTYGFTVDPTTGTLYALNPFGLFTIDPLAPTATLVYANPILSGGEFDGLQIDADGTAWLTIAGAGEGVPSVLWSFSIANPTDQVEAGPVSGALQFAGSLLIGPPYVAPAPAVLANTGLDVRPFAGIAGAGLILGFAMLVGSRRRRAS